MGSVSIAKTDEGIKNGLIKALSLIGGLESYISHQDIVMLKPNINGTEGVTNIELVEELINLLIQFRVKRIVIAESTFGNEQMTNICFNKTGYTDLANKFGIELINLNKSEIVEVEVDNPLVLNKLKVAKEVFEVDKIINLPIMKVHYATGVTLSLKNLKGLLVREEKRLFHEVGLDKAIVDLNRMIKPALNIVDCISCMERMGPKGGDMVDLNLLIAGGNCAEVDYVGSSLMGYNLDEVKHLKYYIEENNIDIENIDIVGEKLDDVSYNFKKAEMTNVIPGEFVIHNKNACSSCMNALLLSCQFLEKEKLRKADIYLGSVEGSVESENMKIAFGNCCSKNKNFDKTIMGCPPFPLSLKKVFEEM